MKFFSSLIIIKLENDLDGGHYHHATKSHEDILTFRFQTRSLKFGRFKSSAGRHITFICWALQIDKSYGHYRSHLTVFASKCMFIGWCHGPLVNHLLPEAQTESIRVSKTLRAEDQQPMFSQPSKGKIAVCSFRASFTKVWPYYFIQPVEQGIPYIPQML